MQRQFCNKKDRAKWYVCKWGHYQVGRGYYQHLAHFTGVICTAVIFASVEAMPMYQTCVWKPELMPTYRLLLYDSDINMLLKLHWHQGKECKYSERIPNIYTRVIVYLLRGLCWTRWVTLTYLFCNKRLYAWRKASVPSACKFTHQKKNSTNAWPTMPRNRLHVSSLFLYS